MGPRKGRDHGAVEVFPYGAVGRGDGVAARDGGEEVVAELVLREGFRHGDLFEEGRVREDDLRGRDGPQVQVVEGGEVVSA